MTHRVIQFPVRNAFAPRSYDSLAHDPQDHTHRIADQVENEISRMAGYQSTGRNTEFERVRCTVVTMQPLTRIGRLRKQVASARTYATSLFKRR